MLQWCGPAVVWYTAVVLAAALCYLYCILFIYMMWCSEVSRVWCYNGVALLPFLFHCYACFSRRQVLKAVHVLGGLASLHYYTTTTYVRTLPCFSYYI